MHSGLIASPGTDEHVEKQIAACLELASPRSFFLYAGAGSGKTRSLVNAVQYAIDRYSRDLMLQGKSIAVITYTNVAADEVARRLDYNPLVNISTIHSFAWTLIRPFQDDIRTQLGIRLSQSVQELEAKSSKPGTKAEETRLFSLEKAKKRIENLGSITRFTYSPTGTNRGRDSLDHAEVIALTASMIKAYPRLSKILASRHPFLFVDESQDTNSDLLDALLLVQKQNQGTFCLGLFGDTMQRIYNDGKQDLEGAIGDNWAKPVKQMNHRSAHRIVQLANSIRSEVDAQAQLARPDRTTGFVRLFLASTSMETKVAEERAAESMARITKDESWLSASGLTADSSSGVKKLILEHRMAAVRLGFGELFDALGSLEANRTSILDGTHSEVTVLTEDVIPLVEAARSGDHYALTAILRDLSPLLSSGFLETLSGEGNALAQHLGKISSSISELLVLWDNGQDPTLRLVAKTIQQSGVLTFPDTIVRALTFIDESNEAEEDDSQPWVRILKCPYSEAANYARYVGGQTEYATHQGVKGLEFPRVMAITSDDEARGFMFSFEKLFGAKALTDADRRNETQGKETSVDRTRRLFYVTCTRAMSSLAVVAFTSDPLGVATYVSNQGWFSSDEVEILGSMSG